MRIRQPATGMRVAIDAVLLAAAVPARAGEAVLDIGCGSGGASLCLAARVPKCRVVGLELQPNLAALARDNAEVNGMSDRLTITAGDLLRPPASWRADAFHHVMANPPYLARHRAAPVGSPAKAAATVEGEAGLDDWVRCALAMVRAKGTITFIHRADSIDRLVAALAQGCGGISIFPLWPAAGRPATRVLVQARKTVASPARILPGLILHQADRGFTAAAEAILRHAAALAW